MRERGLNEVKVMPIVKVDVHAPIFYFPNFVPMSDWLGEGLQNLLSKFDSYSELKKIWQIKKHLVSLYYEKNNNHNQKFTD